MSILNEFERRLEGAIEGIFTKAFRTGVQPVEIAQRILREMDANKSIGLNEVWVPNQFSVALSQRDREKFQQTERNLRRELEQFVRDAAAERGWTLVGPAEVTFETDESLRQGEFACEAALVEGPPGTSGPVPAQPGSSSPSAPSGPAQPGTAAELVLVDRGRRGEAFPLTKDRVIIGRLAESDVPVSDPGVSRRHAEVRREGGDFVIADLGSTNGTRVNEAAVAERRLEEGDRITIGHTVLEFRRR